MENNLFLDVGNGVHGVTKARDQTGSSNEIPWKYIITVGKNIMYILLEKSLIIITNCDRAVLVNPKNMTFDQSQ